jgi:uncharacterized protein (DUF924 family)
MLKATATSSAALVVSPHRNPMLGRATFPEEDAYLKGGGFQG